MASRKRSLDGEDGCDNTAGEGAARKSWVSPVAKQPAQPSSRDDDFRARKKARYGGILGGLNPQYKKVAEDALEKLENNPEECTGTFGVIPVGRLLSIHRREKRRLYSIPGNVISMGQNDCKQLGRPGLDDDVFSFGPGLVSLGNNFKGNAVSVAAGGMHSAAVTDNGHAFTWGGNDEGALGRIIGNTEEPEKECSIPGAVTGFHPMSRDPAARLPPEDAEMIMAAAGSSHTLFLTLSGNVYMTGSYKWDSESFADVRHPDDPVVKSTDEKASSPLGPRKTPVHVWQLPGHVTAISCGDSFNAAITQDGNMYTWGLGRYGELARSQDIATKEPGEDGIVNYTTSQKIGKKDLSGIKEQMLKPMPPVWSDQILGSNHSVLTVSCGGKHILCVARPPNYRNEVLYSAGCNACGQLGHGDFESRLQLTPVESLRDKHIANVAAGADHSLVLDCIGLRMYAFGKAIYGQLGIDTDESKVHTPTTVALPVEEFPRIVEISAGENHSMAITSSGVVYTWGFNEYEQTGIPKVPEVKRPQLMTVNRLVCHASCGAQHTLLLTGTPETYMFPELVDGADDGDDDNNN